MDSKTLYDRAQQLMPGGVNSPVRAFKGVGGSPVKSNVNRRMSVDGSATGDGLKL